MLVMLKAPVGPVIRTMRLVGGPISSFAPLTSARPIFLNCGVPLSTTRECARPFVWPEAPMFRQMRSSSLFTAPPEQTRTCLIPRYAKRPAAEVVVWLARPVKTHEATSAVAWLVKPKMSSHLNEISPPAPDCAPLPMLTPWPAVPVRFCRIISALLGTPVERLRPLIFTEWFPLLRTCRQDVPPFSVPPPMQASTRETASPPTPLPPSSPPEKLVHAVWPCRVTWSSGVVPRLALTERIFGYVAPPLTGRIETKSPVGASPKVTEVRVALPICTRSLVTGAMLTRWRSLSYRILGVPPKMPPS